MKKFKIVDEFKEFAVRGNVIDMAVGVIIGGAFGKIVTSLVNDIITPGIVFLTGRVKIEELSFTIGMSEEGELLQIKYGAFMQNVLDFLIVAVCIFMMVKIMNTILKRHVQKDKKDEAKEEKIETPEEVKVEEVPEPSKEELLLTEIRDILEKLRT